MARGRAKPAASGPVEGRWELPGSWTWSRAADFARIAGGSTPKNASDKSNFDPTGTPWITPADLSGYSQPTISAGRRNLASHVIKKENLLPAGSVLISSRAPVGYCAVAANPVATNQGFRSLILDESVDPFFIRYYVLYSKVYLEENASGTTFKELSGTVLGDLLFPLPSIETQHRIVARIDELFAEIDDGEAALARARSDLATWRKALLKAAVTGALTADWRAANPPTETGAALLARILADRRTRWLADPRNKGKHYKESEIPDTDDLSELPITWAWTNLGFLFDVFVGSTPPRDDPALWDGEVPWVSSGEVSFCRISSTRETIHQNALRDSQKRLHPPGTVMLGMIGEGKTRGQAAILDIWAAHNQNCASIRVSETPVLPEFVYAYLNERYEETRRESTGGNQPALNKARIERFAFPLPPISEQTEIVSLLRVAEDAWEHETLDEGLGMNLRQSILAAAFRGDLLS